MLKKILLGLCAALLALAVFIASRPSTFTVQRSLTMKAKPEYVFPFVNSLYRWSDWSPWNHVDPAMTRAYEGPVLGVGSAFSWSGNHQVGAGRLTIAESRKDELVRVTIELARPQPATYTTTVTIKPVGPHSEVTWAVEGHLTFLGKAAGLFSNLDAQLGPRFDKGLDALRELAEAEDAEEKEEERLDNAVRKVMAGAESTAPAPTLPRQ